MSLYFLSVFLHILCATIWIGGMIFLALVLLPAIKNHPGKAILIHSAGLKFRTVGWIVLVILLFTGLYNAHFRQIEFSWNGLIENRTGRLILYKLLVFFLTIVTSGVHDFYIGTKTTQLWMKQMDAKRIYNFRLLARWVGRINLLLALFAMIIGIIIVRGF